MLAFPSVLSVCVLQWWNLAKSVAPSYFVVIVVLVTPAAAFFFYPYHQCRIIREPKETEGAINQGGEGRGKGKGHGGKEQGSRGSEQSDAYVTLKPREEMASLEQHNYNLLGLT